jgi:hypothetical protein
VLSRAYAQRRIALGRQGTGDGAQWQLGEVRPTPVHLHEDGRAVRLDAVGLPKGRIDLEAIDRLDGEELQRSARQWLHVLRQARRARSCVELDAGRDLCRLGHGRHTRERCEGEDQRKA